MVGIERDMSENTLHSMEAGTLLDCSAMQSPVSSLVSDAYSGLKAVVGRASTPAVGLACLPILGAIIARRPALLRRSAGDLAELEIVGAAPTAGKVSGLARLEANWQSVSGELKESWLNHNVKALNLDAAENAFFQSALKDGGVKFALLDRQFLQGERIFARDVVRPSVQREIGTATNYDPLKASQAVLICRVPGAKFDQFHIINGNNRVNIFGSSISNPKEMRLPAFIFSSPNDFERVLNYDVLCNLAKAKPLHLH